MMQKPICILLMVLLVVVFGCSLSDNSPASLNVQPGHEKPFHEVAPKSSICSWGLYDISIDTGNWEISVIPLRGAQFTVDVVTFMQPPKGNPANLALKITDASQWLDEGLLTVDVTLKHPFPGLHQYTGHDVKGVLMAPGTVYGLYDDGVWYTNGVDGCKLLNADGYTRWMNPNEFVPDGTILNFVPGKLGTPNISLFSSTINGYKYFADGISSTESVKHYYQDPAKVHNRGQFRAGAANTREYKLKFPYNSGPILEFQYAVVAHWVEPVNLDPYNLPGSFPRSANADEAIYMEVAADNSNLWFDGSNGGGKISLEIEVFDQGGPFNPSGVPSEISNIIIESHDKLIPGSFAVIPAASFVGTAKPGSAGNSSIVTVEIPNCIPASNNLTEPLLITIESAAPTTFDPGTGNPPTDAALAGYFFYGGLKISEQSPYVNPVTDLKLKVNRVAGGTAFESLELFWTNTNAAEYAVYTDNNPYDNGGVFNIDYVVPVAVVSASPAIITNFDRNGQYVFTVRARKTPGDKSSESADSNLAFVELDDGGSATDPGNWLYGGNSMYPGQMKMQRGATFGNGGGWGYFVDNGTYANACMSMWSCLCTPQLPEIPGATESFIEWAHWYYDCWKPATFPSCNYPNNYPGFTAGGATSPPPLNNTSGMNPSIVWYEFDIFYGLPDDPPGGFGDPATHTGGSNPSINFFFGVPSFTAIWHGTNTNWLVSRVNAQTYLDSIDYAAVTASTHSTLNNWTADEGHYFMDDLAVVVY